MDTCDLRGKRKRGLDPCPNPLFTQWLTEWRDDAANKGIKTQFVYAKALRTLKKYPLTLESGKECKMLECFGDKICKMLDDKLCEYVAEYGTTDPVPGYITVPSVLAAEKKRKPKKQQSRGMQRDNFDGLRIPLPQGGSGIENSDEPVRKRQKSGVGRPKEYIPQYRSGPYAIVLTLFHDLQKAGSQGHMTKRELMYDAQPLADKSFSIPDPGSRYTAWSSMGSLINKGFVVKESNPAKYRLTDTGKALAQRIIDAEQEVNAGVSHSGSQLGFTLGLAQPDSAPSVSLQTDLDRTQNIASCKSNTKTVEHKGFDSDTDLPEMCKTGSSYTSRSHGRSVLSNRSNHAISDDSDEDLPSLTSRINKPYQAAEPPPSFQFHYVNDNGKEVMDKDKAAVLIDEEISVGFLIQCDYEDLLVSGKTYKLDMTRSNSDGKIYAYLANKQAPEKSTAVSKVNICKPPPLQTSTKSASHAAKYSFKKTTSNSATDLCRGSLQSSISSIKNPTSTASSSSSSSSSAAAAAAGGSAFQVSHSSSLTRQQSWQSSVSASQSSTASTASTASSLSSSSTLPEPHFTLYPGRFDILLIIDNHEHFGGSKMSRQVLLPELRKNGVHFDVRPLQVADFLWVARPKGVKDCDQELVLDYVIERKRMDDLSHSIVDGRFREQKFRMRNCGARYPIYLVEDYGSTQHFSVSEDALTQAITNTQVIDGFYVKRTKDMKESIAYLTVMTRYLQSTYSKKTLMGQSKSALKETGFKGNLTDREHNLMTFKEFNQESVKTKAMSVREMFGKQLVQISGVTPEKAAAIIQVYGTPHILLEALGNCATEKQKENLLNDIKFGPLKRNIGGAISKNIAMLYTRNSLL